MKISEILSRCDHTLLSVTATQEDIFAAAFDGQQFGVASVCVPPCYVRAVKANFKVPVCTVIGFPNGYMTTECKLFETKHALHDGADEIDFVINVGQLKAKNYDYVINEIETLKRACGSKILKVIIETCLLTDDEKIKMCKIVHSGGADFLKTSTGFAFGGATREDIVLLRKHLHPSVKIKAAGGIKTIEDAEEFILLGADRLGTSRIIPLVKKQSTKKG